MTVTSLEGKTPSIGDGTRMHPSADVIGDVRLGARCWVGPGARRRGDYGTIVLGDCCAVEDNCVVRTRPGETCTIGSWVTLRHGCVAHSVTLLGVPARLLDRAVWSGFKQTYVDLCERYREGFGR